MSIEKQKLDIENIVKAGKKVYLGYLLLDIINDKKNSYFTINNKRGLSLNEYVTESIKEEKADKFSKQVKIGKKNCKIHIEKNSDDKYDVKITGTTVSDCEDSGYESDNSQGTQTQNIEFKPKNKYNDDDFLDLCSSHELTFSCDNNDHYAFSTKIDEHIIGGLDKIDLYPIHISNLYQMINYVNGDTKNPNVLIAMATGSGKSFTQALWTFVLDLADYHGICAVHQDTLASQLKEDFCRLLPKSITDKVKLCDKGAIGKIDPNSHIITTHDILFKEKSSECETIFVKNNKWWISVDEAHKATEVELYKRNIENLKNPIAFLTATPSEVIAKRVGCIINLSLKEKEKQGVSKSPAVKTRTAKSRIQAAKKKSKFNFGERIALWFASIIEKERLSSAHECIGSIEECVIYRKTTDPFYVSDGNESDIRKSIRWNVHLSIGEKFLGLVGRGSHDSVVNFHLMLNGNEVGSAYESGNKVSRENVYDFFGLSLLSSHGAELDEAIFKKYEESKQELRKAGLRNYLIDYHGYDSNKAENFIESNVDYSSNAAKYQEFHVLHGIIENTISYLTGYDSITLDYKRRHDLDSLVKEVKAKLSSKNIGDTEEHMDQISKDLISEGIPQDIAESIATQEIRVLQALLQTRNDDDEFFKMIVDNWALDKRIHNQYLGTDNCSYSPLLALQEFCQKHKTIFLVNGLQKSATKVEDNKPFFNLKEKSFKLSDDNHDKEKNLTKHKLSTIEALDDTTKQYYYEPNYCSAEYTEKVVDKLCKKGLIGSYITSEKTTGFNDLNLCSVGLITDKTDDNINDPAEIIQAFGRNRGLNWAKQPIFYLVTKSGVKVSFDVNELTRNGYIKALNKADKKHHKELVKRLGSKIAKQIQDYIDINTEPSGEIHSNHLENKLIEIIWNEYEDLYNQNNHDNQKTKNDFIDVLNDTYKILYSYRDNIKKNYHLPTSAHVITFILEFITKIVYWFKTHSSYKEFKQEVKKLENNEKKDELINERTYAHIIQNYKYKDIISNGLALKKILSLTGDKVKSSTDFIMENLHEFVKEERKEELNQLNQTIKTLLNKLVVTTGLSKEQKEQITQYINEKNSWAKEVYDHAQSLFSNDQKIGSNDISSIIFNLISSDSTIKQYLEKEKITKEKFYVNVLNDLSIFTELQNSPLIKELTSCNYENVIDKDKAEQYTVNSIAHYFQSKVYQKLLNDFISPLKEEHLLAILNTVYPEDNANKTELNSEKLKKILEFKKGIDDEERFREVVKKCGDIEKIQDIQESIYKVCFEILHCYCYYQNMSEKGDLYCSDKNDIIPRDKNLATPELYKRTNNKKNSIWSYSSRGSDFDIGMMCNKIQFISGSLKSFDDTSEIDLLDQIQKVQHGQEAADNLQLFNRALKYPKNNTTSTNREIEKVASKLGDLKPLTSKDYDNAVQQVRSAFSPPAT
ncbi:DEAD/DEAH box helicase family protein [Wolbachia endosymbiont (group A) of Epistrophe grossularia]|uniref:DEAD/DEAH box helicase family protein n=1 Tax=Wolbachia endosymbiont (group A) of Epistrophe grossularia TaxID=2954008 RepID=UPI0022307854|nr:DEAD/DEAH box helicase family protein [Wolbachia endosymbiont (group A) of Epistrophe grossularia]